MIGTEYSTLLERTFYRLAPAAGSHADFLAVLVEQGAPVFGRRHRAEARVTQQLREFPLPSAERRDLGSWNMKMRTLRPCMQGDY